MSGGKAGGNKRQQTAGKEIAPPRVACFLFLPSIRLVLMLLAEADRAAPPNIFSVPQKLE
jgi:hypothetical protein